MDALMKASHKMAEEMYKKAGPQQSGPQGQPGPQQSGPQDNPSDQPKKDNKGDGPVDADFTVVDDK
jgi:hypothetical protein